MGEETFKVIVVNLLWEELAINIITEIHEVYLKLIVFVFKVIIREIGRRVSVIVGKQDVKIIEVVDLMPIMLV